MDAAAFVDKWRKLCRTERSASQEHFLDLCEVLKHPKPGVVDPRGLTFTTERRVTKAGGKHGFADAWKKGFFGWEYKKKGGDLNEAYNQLLQYSGDLGNPPLLVVSDMDRIEIRTRFTDYPTTSHTITLDTFATPSNLEKLRCCSRPRKASAREDDREDYRGSRQETGGACPEYESPVLPLNKGGALSGPPDLLHVRRRRRALAQSCF